MANPQLTQNGKLAVGYFVRRRRKRLGLTVEALGGLARVTGPAIVSLESGVRRPTERTLHRLTDAMGLPGEDKRDLFYYLKAVRGGVFDQVELTHIADGLGAPPLAPLEDFCEDVTRALALLEGSLLPADFGVIKRMLTLMLPRDD